MTIYRSETRQEFRRTDGSRHRSNFATMDSSLGPLLLKRMMSLQTNPQLELAFEYVRNTNKSLFLTGKAGSGKTTFLHQIKAEGTKRMAVVAPTGVAAINAGGDDDPLALSTAVGSASAGR